MQSKKHRDRERSGGQQPNVNQSASDMVTSETYPGKLTVTSGVRPSTSTTAAVGPEDEDDQVNDTEDDDEEEIEERLAAARRRIRPSDCLFCSVSSKSVQDNVTHMSRYHSFFIPDQEILTDMSGLLSYLGEKVVLGNLCLYCPNGGKEFGDVDAVRRHMVDKSHCKLAYETNEDRAELADYYDYKTVGREDDEWEDMSDDGAEESEIFEVRMQRKFAKAAGVWDHDRTRWSFPYAAIWTDSRPPLPSSLLRSTSSNHYS